jgi:PHD/YefM family antitoxin component YafN of YafNO toxin-antitoxin module
MMVYKVMYMEDYMEQSMNISEARTRLTRLPEELGATSAIRITRKQEPVLAVLSWEFYETLMETLEILGDEASRNALREGIRALRQGRTISVEDLARELKI